MQKSYQPCLWSFNRSRLVIITFIVVYLNRYVFCDCLTLVMIACCVNALKNHIDK
jgi:hypothetical protein